MQTVLLVGFGGFIGAILRYTVGVLTSGISTKIHFPIATLTVNLIGCFAIGIFGFLLVERQLMPTWQREFLIIGVCGAFTTYSTFGLESFLLFCQQQFFKAVLNVCLHIVLGFAAVWAGYFLSRRFLV